MVTAKILCVSKQENGENENRVVTVTFGPDYADGRNKEWAVNTPTLNLVLGLRPEFADRYEVGGRYTLAFTPPEE
jgi:hypothetical protein